MLNRHLNMVSTWNWDDGANIITGRQTNHPIPSLMTFASPWLWNLREPSDGPSFQALLGTDYHNLANFRGCLSIIQNTWLTFWMFTLFTCTLLAWGIFCALSNMRHYNIRKLQYKKILPSNKAFLTPTTVMELLTLFFFLFLPRRHKDEKTSDIAWHWCTCFTFLIQNVWAFNLHGIRGLYQLTDCCCYELLNIESSSRFCNREEESGIIFCRIQVLFWC